jgi:fatty acyl-CoA reductase
MCRKLRERWANSLPTRTIERLLNKRHLTAIDGDILLLDMGLSQKDLSTLRKNVNLVIHSASSINLAKPLRSLSKVIVGASEMMAEFALTCEALDRFVYISTAYANSHLCPSNHIIDVKINEDIYEPSCYPNVTKEWAEVQQFGTSQVYKEHDFPWSYAYAKNLTERLLLHRFTQTGVECKLLIVRPSIIGPAQAFPFTGYSVPRSTPSTMLATGLALSPAWSAVIATKATEPESEVYSDEVPVDVVVDRLLGHLAMGTYGCVHAVSGKRSRFTLQAWLQSAAKLRRLPWVIRPLWRPLDWKSPAQHPLARLYVILGTSFHFSEDKTVELSYNTLVNDCEGLQLFTTINLVEQLLSRTKHIHDVINHIASKSMWAWLVVKLFYRDFEDRQ